MLKPILVSLFVLGCFSAAKTEDKEKIPWCEGTAVASCNIKTGTPDTPRTGTLSGDTRCSRFFTSMMKQVKSKTEPKRWMYQFVQCGVADGNKKLAKGVCNLNKAAKCRPKRKQFLANYKKTVNYNKVVCDTPDGTPMLGAGYKDFVSGPTWNADAKEKELWYWTGVTPEGWLVDDTKGEPIQWSSPILRTECPDIISLPCPPPPSGEDTRSEEEKNTAEEMWTMLRKSIENIDEEPDTGDNGDSTQEGAGQPIQQDSAAKTDTKPKVVKVAQSLTSYEFSNGAKIGAAFGVATTLFVAFKLITRKPELNGYRHIEEI